MMICTDVQVDPWFLRTCSRWLLISGAEGGGYFLRSADVISGRDDRKPTSRAFILVDSDEEPDATYRKEIFWVMVAWWMKGNAMYVESLCSIFIVNGGVIDLCGNWMRHRGDVGLMWSLRIILVLRTMNIWFVLMCTVYPVTQRRHI